MYSTIYQSKMRIFIVFVVEQSEFNINDITM